MTNKNNFFFNPKSLNLYLQVIVLNKYISIPYLILSYYKFLLTKKQTNLLLTAISWNSYLKHPKPHLQHKLFIHFLFNWFTKQSTNIYWSAKQLQWCQVNNYNNFILQNFYLLRDSFFFNASINIFSPAKTWLFLIPRHIISAPNWLNLLDIKDLPSIFLNFLELDGFHYYKFNFQLYFHNSVEAPSHFTKVFAFRLLHYPIMYSKISFKLLLHLQYISFNTSINWKELEHFNSLKSIPTRRQRAVLSIFRYFLALDIAEGTFVEFLVHYRLKELLFISEQISADLHFFKKHWYSKVITRHINKNLIKYRDNENL